MLPVIVAFVFLLSRKTLTLGSAATGAAWFCYLMPFLYYFGTVKEPDFLAAAGSALLWGTLYLAITVGLARLFLRKKFNATKEPPQPPEPPSVEAEGAK